MFHNSSNCPGAFKLRNYYTSPLLSRSQLSFSLAPFLMNSCFMGSSVILPTLRKLFCFGCFRNTLRFLKIKKYLEGVGREETRLATRLFDLDLLFLHSTKVSSERYRRPSSKDSGRLRNLPFYFISAVYSVKPTPLRCI